MDNFSRVLSTHQFKINRCLLLNKYIIFWWSKQKWIPGMIGLEVSLKCVFLLVFMLPRTQPAAANSLHKGECSSRTTPVLNQ